MRTHPDCRSWVVVAGICAAAVFFWMWRLAHPIAERLSPIEFRGLGTTVRNGRLVWIDRDDRAGTITLRARPAAGGAVTTGATDQLNTRPLYLRTPRNGRAAVPYAARSAAYVRDPVVKSGRAVPPDRPVYRSVTGALLGGGTASVLAVEGSGAYCIVARSLLAPGRAPGAAVGMSIAPMPTPPFRRIERISYAAYLKRFRIPARPDPPPHQSEYRLRFLPFDSSAPRDVPSAINGIADWQRRFTASGGFVYWLAGPPSGQPKYVDIWKGSTGPHWYTFGPPEARGTVMAAPLTGGPARAVASGVYPYARLVPVGDGVVWHPVRDEPLLPGQSAQPTDLVWARGNGAPPRALHGSADLQYPLILGNRLYGIRQPMARASEGEIRLVSLGLDGSPTLESRIPALPASTVVALESHAGRLYAILDEPLADHGSAAQWLILIHTDRDQTTTRIARFPHECRFHAFDGEWFYYAAAETHENWTDWSAGGLAQQNQEILYRVRLPLGRN